MPPLDTTAALAGFQDRGPGTDAERRAARWLAAELVAKRHRVRIETFWCRPNWALAHCWHIALALAGSLISVSHATVGAVLLAIALISTIADSTIGISLGRRLTPERASQNVVVSPTPADQPATTTRLIITANYDAGRTGLIYRDALRATVRRLNRATGGAAPGWLAWLAIAIVWLLAIAIIRATSHHPSGALGAVQLPPTVALVIGLALLLDAAGAGYGPAAGDNGTGTAAAIELTRVLAADRPRNLAIELVLQGAGESEGIGLRSYLRTRRRELKNMNAIVLGIAASGTGEPAWWLSDGRLVPLRYARSLRALCAQTGATPHRGRGATPALPARAAGVAAIAIGCLDSLGRAPRSHQKTDTPQHLNEAALSRTLDFGLRLVEAIDASLAPADATTGDANAGEATAGDATAGTATPA
jgi:Peptidase family M28